ncbi:hypothetical protein P7C70_g4863, partial [Phenoliferia sp. Uapishka_3]
MSPLVNHGDVLKIERYESAQGHGHLELLPLEWSQRLTTHRESYYAVKATNTSQNNVTLPMFVQKDWFDDMDNGNSIERHSSRDGGSDFERHILHSNADDPMLDFISFTVDSKFQYGQKNGEGDLRFVVYHDRERKIYQHRFVASLLARCANDAKDVADWFGAGDVAGAVNDLARNFVGDYLHNF